MLPKAQRDREAHVLVVDDDQNLRLILTDRLRASGYRVDEAADLGQGMQSLERESYDLLLLDIYLPDQSGLEGLRRIRGLHPSTAVIVMTAHGTIDLAVEAMKEGAYDFVTKPLDFKRLGLLAERAIEGSQLRTEVDYLRRVADEPFSDIVGEESGLKETMELVRSVAGTDSTVLVRGETGTGKEVVARAIHRLSERHRKPFVVANCAAIPHDLMESEMFGHSRGAFTGAISDHAGYFEAAGGGTLLLDEIGDLNLDLQAKILRVLEDGSFRRVGSSRMQHNHARLIASTHQPLESLMEEGRFREDLYYRLNVVPVELPPLRARRADIPRLANHFLQLYTRGHRQERPQFEEDALRALQEHPWWGNVRELRNCVERLAITIPGTLVRLEDVLPLLVERPGREARRGVHPLKVLERQAIEHALTRFHGNRTRTAEALGIGRRTLQNKIKLYGLAERQKVGQGS